LALLTSRRNKPGEPVHPQNATSDSGDAVPNTTSPIVANTSPPPNTTEYTYQCNHPKSPWWKGPAEIIAVLIALGLLIVNICQSRSTEKAAGAAQTANENAQKALVVTQQANVTIGRADGTVAEILWPKGKTGKAGLMVYFQNSGHLPAKFNWGSVSPVIAVLPSFDNPENGKKDIVFQTDHWFDPMWRVVHKDGSVNWSGTIEIAGNSSYQGLLWELPKERMKQLIDLDAKIGPDQRPFMTNGRFEYCDGFGNRVCRDFDLRYQGEPYNRFALANEDECPKWEMQGHREKHGDLSEFRSPCTLPESREELQPTIPSLAKP
jgi:hypothetical protein